MCITIFDHDDVDDEDEDDDNVDVNVDDEDGYWVGRAGVNVAGWEQKVWEAKLPSLAPALHYLPRMDTQR